jgi:hypothetical protein
MIMNFKQGIAARWLMVSMASLLATAPLAAATLQQMDALAKQVEQLNGQCEAARQKALAPIRAQKTKACIDQQLRSKEHCERYYTTYGDVTPGPSGAPQGGYFFDLPPCVDWLTARKKLEDERSRP